MISKLADWYRIAEHKPDDSTIEKRKSAILEVVKTIEESDDLSLLGGLVSLVVSGEIVRRDSHQPIIDTMMSSLCKYQPSLPTDPFANLATLRACASVAAGEIIHLPDGDTDKRTGLDVLGSSLMVSAIGLRPPPKERTLQKVLSELLSISESTLRIVANTIRQRRSASDELANLEAETEIKKIAAIIKSVVVAQEQQTSIDREELELLWWMRGGYSSILNKPIVKLDVPNAAVICAIELADRCLIPPPESVSEMVLELVSKDRSIQQMKDLDLDHFVKGIDPSLPSHLTIPNDEVKMFTLDCPVIFPLSSVFSAADRHVIADRGNESSRSTRHFSPLSFARQMFNERISQRLLQEKVLE